MDDIAATLAPKSEQMDAVDLLGASRIFTVERVTGGSDEQPVNVHLAEFPRPWRPNVSMRRVLAFAWGAKSSEWTGRRVELFNDTEVTFGPDKTGGVRIKAMSHIDGPITVPLLVKRGKSQGYKVVPLPDAPNASTITAESIEASTDVDSLREWWKSATPTHKKLIEARVKSLTTPDPMAALAGEEVAS